MWCGHFEESQERKKEKKKRKETINACVSEGRYKLDSWRVERIDFRIFCGTRVLFRADEKEFDAFRNNFMSALFVSSSWANSLKYSGLGSWPSGAVE